MAQLLSVVGDQLARVALTVLVYDRTRSALLAAITFVASIVPTFIGGLTLAWLADRYPRRGVMIACDLIRFVLVLVMAIPGLPLAALVLLLFLVTLTESPFSSARAAIYPDVLTGDSYVMGTAVTLTTFQFAQVIGFAAGGAIVGFFGVRASLVIDAATFVASALIVRAWVRARPAPATPARSDEDYPGSPGSWPEPAWCSAIESCAHRCCSAGLPRSTTLRREWSRRWPGTVGGGAAAVGMILAAQALGETVGAIVFSRFVLPPVRLRFMGPLAVATCAVLVLFIWRPGLLVSLLILFASGLCASYQLAANAAFVSAAPNERRSQAFGLAQGGMSLGQGTVLILAGAAAQHHAPARVIAVCGAVGAVLALAITASWARDHSRRMARHHQRA